MKTWSLWRNLSIMTTIHKDEIYCPDFLG